MADISIRCWDVRSGRSSQKVSLNKDRGGGGAGLGCPLAYPPQGDFGTRLPVGLGCLLGFLRAQAVLITWERVIGTFFPIPLPHPLTWQLGTRRATRQAARLDAAARSWQRFLLCPHLLAAGVRSPRIPGSRGWLGLGWTGFAGLGWARVASFSPLSFPVR